MYNNSINNSTTTNNNNNNNKKTATTAIATHTHNKQQKQRKHINKHLQTVGKLNHFYNQGHKGQEAQQEREDKIGDKQNLPQVFTLETSAALHFNFQTLLLQLQVFFEKLPPLP